MGVHFGMNDPFHEKLVFLMKVLSLSRAHVAMQLRVDKSLVGRWATGKATPSAYNLSRLTALVAEKASRFSMLDWERSIDGIAALVGVERGTLGESGQMDGLAEAIGAPIARLMDEALPTTAYRGPSYEGFFQTTRPFHDKPGRFIHGFIMLRMEHDGLLSYTQSTAGVRVEGRMIALHSQLFVIAVETTSRSPVFIIINGINALRAKSYEGLAMYCALDATRTPVALPFIAERIADLQGSLEADTAMFAEIVQRPPLAPEGSVPADIAAHLYRDFGPKAFELGGEMLLSLPLARSLARPVLPD